MFGGLDRLCRSQVNTLKLIDFLSKHKVAFKSVTEPFDTAIPLEQAMLEMLSIFVQFERKSIAQPEGWERRKATSMLCW